jgi:hypothetical protein
VEIERHRRIIRKRVQVIELVRQDHGLTAPGVSDESDAAHVDAAIDRTAGIGGPVTPLLQVFEQQPRPGGDFLRVCGLEWISQCISCAAVEEVLIHGHQDESLTCEMLAEVGVPRFGGLPHGVIAVDNQYKWKGSLALRHPNSALQRHVRSIKAPVVRSQCPAQATPHRIDLGAVH